MTLALVATLAATATVTLQPPVLAATATVTLQPPVLAATATVTLQPPVLAGQGASQPEGHRQMVALLRQIADDGAETNFYFGDGPARRLRAELDALPAGVTGPARWRLMIQLAEAELRLGNELESIRLYTQARNLVPVSGPEGTWPNYPVYRLYSQYRLGVAYTRFGETQNCALHPSADTCILPLRGDGIHTQREPSRQAISAFTDVLDNSPGPTSVDGTASESSRNLSFGTSGELLAADTSLHLASRWLLNIAYMTLGAYPEQVPEQYLLPPETFSSTDQIPRFNNIAPALGLDTFDNSGGAIADDFDGDGYLDIFVSTWDLQGQIRFFRNNQDGTFSERTDEAGLGGLYGGLNIVHADYDNDGDLDVFVLRGAWMREGGQHPNSLLRNNGDATFTDVTFDAGLGDVHYPTQTASWGDYDNDGDLDLAIGNETVGTLVAPNQLFRNNSDGTFTDVAADAVVMNHRWSKAVVWGDYDGDRLLDLYVSNLGGPNRLYRNTGRGTFIDVARRLGVALPGASFPGWFWDVDNDGVLDLYVAAYDARIEDLASRALNLPPSAELARLYRGTGDGRFEDVTTQYDLTSPNLVMGANFGDLDNDGYLDFYVGTGDPRYESLMPNVMYRNRSGEAFSNVTYSGGFGHLQKGHGVVFADLDNDGDQDVFEQMGGAFPGDRFRNALYENPGFGNHWITINLVGVQSNRSAIGARIHAQVVEDGTRRSVYRHVNSGGSFGGNPLRQTVGLGKASEIERLEIFWPTTGLTQTFSDIPVDRAIQIVEGDASYTTLELETLTLGG